MEDNNRKAHQVNQAEGDIISKDENSNRAASGDYHESGTTSHETNNVAKYGSVIITGGINISR